MQVSRIGDRENNKAVERSTMLMINEKETRKSRHHTRPGGRNAGVGD
jgi:hypothetical protein